MTQVPEMRKALEPLLWSLYLKLNQTGVPEEKQIPLLSALFAAMRSNDGLSTDRFDEIFHNVLSQ